MERKNSGKLIPICCVCNAIRLPDSDHKDLSNWVSKEDERYKALIEGANESDYSHGYCPACFKEAIKELRK